MAYQLPSPGTQRQRAHHHVIFRLITIVGAYTGKGTPLATVKVERCKNYKTGIPIWILQQLQPTVAEPSELAPGLARGGIPHGHAVSHIGMFTALMCTAYMYTSHRQEIFPLCRTAFSFSSIPYQLSGTTVHLIPGPITKSSDSALMVSRCIRQARISLHFLIKSMQCISATEPIEPTDPSYRHRFEPQ